jgi:peptidoglycan-N-acetylmuramic acid deacetylase
MGYRSIFWSFAYRDWNADWNTKEQSLEWMKNYYHPGAIYLLHGVSTGNAEALDEFISFLHGQGYKFDVVTNL